MKNSFKTILLFLIILIILSGVLAFLYKEELWGALTKRTETGLSEIEYKPNISLEETIDISVLDSPVLNTLKNNVNNFDFDNVCYRPTITIQTSEGTITQKTSACSVGSRLPFISGDK